MNTKNLLILGAVGLGIYLMMKAKKKIVLTQEMLMAMSLEDLNALLIDLGKQASQSKYEDPGVYSYWVVTELNKRKTVNVVDPIAITPIPKSTTAQSGTNYGPSTGVVAPMSF
jgi:hypothetical protein